MQIKTDSFIVNADTDAGAFDVLLKLTGYTKASFSAYMGINEAELQEPPKWALNYLKDLLDANYIHLGYVMKDTKIAGLIGTYENLEKEFNDLINAGTLTGNQPIIIDKAIITEAGPIKASYIVNAEQILKTLIDTAGQ